MIPASSDGWLVRDGQGNGPYRVASLEGLKEDPERQDWTVVGRTCSGNDLPLEEDFEISTLGGPSEKVDEPEVPAVAVTKAANDEEARKTSSARAANEVTEPPRDNLK